jgi:hypothetical protein
MDAADVVFERRTDDGAAFRITVQGFRCPVCGEEVMSGEQAEYVSYEWGLFRLRMSSLDTSQVSPPPMTSESPHMPALTAGTLATAAA